MRMNINLRHLKVGKVIIIPLTGQKDVNTVINIGTNDQRYGFLRISFFLSHLFIDHINETVLIDERRLLSNRVGKLDRRIDKMQIILLSTCTWRTQTPSTLFTRFGATRILHIGTTSRTTRFRLSNNPWVCLHMERLQPGGTTMVTGERHTFAKMWIHMRKRQLPSQRTELNRMPLPRMRWKMFWVFICRFSLRQCLSTFPVIIPNRSVIG